MNKRMETAGRTPRLALALLVLAFLLNAGGVSASDSSLELSDFNRGGLEVEAAALFEAGDAGSEPALYSASGSRWTESGSLVDGEALLGEGSSIVRVMLPQSDGSLLRLNVDGPLVLRDYFGSSGGGADLTVWIQTAQVAVSFAASDVSSVGSSYVNFNVPQAARSTLSGIASGDRFILALTRPAPAPDPTPTPDPAPEPTSEPGAITGLTMTSSQPERLWVSWDQADPEPTEYRLNWAPVDEPFPAWNSNQGGNLWLSPRTAQDFSNVVNPGVTYKLRMRAIYKTGPNAPWSGPWSEVVTQRVGNHPPGAPTDLSVDSATHDSVALSWSAPGHSGLTGYRILRGGSPDTLETLVEDTGDLPLTYTDTTAADDATHHYAVVALSLDGDSPQSATVSATTPPQPTPTPEPTPEPPQGPLRGVEIVEEEEDSVSEEQQEDDTCAPEIESVGGSASNGNVQWKWKNVAPPAPAAGVDGCENRWVDFRLSYSDDYGATFTGAEVVHHYIHNTDSATITIGGEELNRNEEYHSASAPELSIVSKLRVEVGCDADGANCAHSLDSTPGSFKPYYSSRYAGRDDGANTEALLVPANYCTDCWGNASVIGWLDIGEDPHTYRIHMTAGRTYIFDETYRKWAMTSGEWRDGKHYYLPDEFRISLFTKNSADALVAVSDFQDQPEHGWQAIVEDNADDYQAFGPAFVTDTIEGYFQKVEDLFFLFGNADFFPPGNRYRHACNADKNNVCGPGLNIYRDDGRQLRTASYTPTQSGIYYLQVTRIRDDQPVRRSSFGWSLSMSDNGEPGGEGFMAVYAQGANKEGLRNAFPYYELSVEVRGPTLTSIGISGDSYIEYYEETHDGNHFGFLPGRFEYRVGLGSTETVTLAATAANTDATVTITPGDADTSTDGHQVNTPAGVFTDVTITVTRGTDTETYTIKLSRP